MGSHKRLFNPPHPPFRALKARHSVIFISFVLNIEILLFSPFLKTLLPFGDMHGGLGGGGVPGGCYARGHCHFLFLTFQCLDGGSCRCRLDYLVAPMPGNSLMPFSMMGRPTSVSPCFNPFKILFNVFVVMDGVASGFLLVLGSLGYSPSLSVFCLSVLLFIQPSTSLIIHVPS